MKKVYDDKRLGYGKVTEFQKPAEMDKDPISADINPAEVFNKSDGNNTPDVGNGAAEDYGDMTTESTEPTILLPADTNKQSSPGKKTEEKKNPPPALNNEEKKKVKPTAGNEY